MASSDNSTLLPAFAPTPQSAPFFVVLDDTERDSEFCFGPSAPSLKAERIDLGQLAYDEEQLARAGFAGAAFLREVPALYSIEPTTRTRRRITIGDRTFALGDHVAVLARPLPGQDDNDRRVLCTAYIDGIAERWDHYQITPREVTFGLVGVLSPDGTPIADLHTATAAAELVAPIETRGLGL